MSKIHGWLSFINVEAFLEFHGINWRDFAFHRGSLRAEALVQKQLACLGFVKLGMNSRLKRVEYDK